MPEKKDLLSKDVFKTITENTATIKAILDDDEFDLDEEEFELDKDGKRRRRRRRVCCCPKFLKFRFFWCWVEINNFNAKCRDRHGHDGC